MRSSSADVASALCGLFAGAPVYAPAATSDWNASIRYAAGGELEFWLMAPKKQQALPQAGR